MQVIATKLGNFGKLREPGDKFDVPDGETATWFVPVEPVAEGKGKKSKDEAKGAADLV
ncbi:MAG: hypothetical protein WA049_06325 [Ferribacterium limneticum]